MTTELYISGDADKGSQRPARGEASWLIEEIIKPQLPNILDNVKMCLDLFQSGEIYTMPLSSSTKENDHTLPFVKGIIARQDQYIVDFQAVVRFPHLFNGKSVLFKMTSEDEKFPLVQYQMIIDNLRKITERLTGIDTTLTEEEFMTMFTEVMGYLNESVVLLQQPSRELLYPYNNNEPMKQLLGKSYEKLKPLAPNNEISLEITLYKNELCVELRNLTRVTKRPWSVIDPETGQSFIDKIKQQLTSERTKSLRTVLHENGIELEDSGFITTLFNSTFKQDTFTTLKEAQDCLRRGATFDGIAVLEDAKILATTSDPTLISISTKLRSLQHSIRTHFENLKIELGSAKR